MEIGTGIAMAAPWAAAVVFGVFVNAIAGVVVAAFALFATMALSDMEPRP